MIDNGAVDFDDSLYHICASAYPNLDIVKYLFYKGVNNHQDSFESASASGYANIVECFIIYYPDEYNCDYAVKIALMFANDNAVKIYEEKKIDMVIKNFSSLSTN